MMFIVCHIHAIDPVTKTEVVIRVTDLNSYTWGDFTYLPYLDSVLNFEEQLFSKGTTSGDASIGTGEVVLNAEDGELDQYRFFGFDGQKIELFALDSTLEEPSDLNAYFTGIMTYTELALDKFTFFVRNRFEDIKTDIQTKTFAGDNLGPVGYEGTADTIKGQIKPMTWGQVINAPAALLNSSTLIYGVNFDKAGDRKAVDSIWKVLDKGGEIFFQADVANAVALDAAVVAPGCYQTCLAEGMFKLGTVPKGDVTCNVYEVMGEEASAPRIVRRILEDVYSLTAGADFDAASLDALHTLNPASVGYYVDTEVPGVDVCTNLLDSIGGWMAPNRLGVFYFGRVDLPADTAGLPVAVYTDDLMKRTLKRVNTGDSGEGIPAKQVTILHTKMWKVLSKSETLESVSSDLRDYYAQEFRSVTSEDSDITLVHKNAPALSFETLLVEPRNLGVPQFLEEDDGIAPSNWDRTGGYSASTTLVNGADRSCTLSPDGVGIAELRHTLGGVGPLVTVVVGSMPSVAVLTQFLELYPADLLVRYYVVDNAHSNLRVSLQIEGSEIGGQDAPSTAGWSSFSVSYTAAMLSSVGIDIVIQSRTATADTSTVSHPQVYHHQYGLGPEEEADRRLAILSADTERFTFDVPLSEGYLRSLGDKVTLQTNRVGLDDGKDFIVIGKNLTHDDNNVSLDVYG